MRAEWDWDTLGSPDPRALRAVRRPASGALSRHIPVSAYSVTTGTHHELESSLEHELFRELEHRSDVTWIVEQPVMLHLATKGRATHVPDLLSLTSDGRVTLWDARPARRMDDLFGVKVEWTAAACRAVGWSYELYSGTSRVRRLNLRWLHEYRWPQPWYPQAKRVLLALVTSDRSTTVGAIMTHADADPEVVSAMWHFVWSGDLVCDLDRPLRAATTLAWSDDRE